LNNTATESSVHGIEHGTATIRRSGDAGDVRRPAVAAGGEPGVGTELLASDQDAAYRNALSRRWRRRARNRDARRCSQPTLGKITRWSKGRDCPLPATGAKDSVRRSTGKQRIEASVSVTFALG